MLHALYDPQLVINGQKVSWKGVGLKYTLHLFPEEWVPVETFLDLYLEAEG